MEKEKKIPYIVTLKGLISRTACFGPHFLSTIEWMWPDQWQAFKNTDDESGQPVVVMETPGERSVPVVGGVVEGKHLLWRGTVDREGCLSVRNHRSHVWFTLTVPQTELLLLLLL